MLICGILPPLTARELDISYLTPRLRYYAFDNILRQMRKDDFEVHIQGNDELMLCGIVTKNNLEELWQRMDEPKA